MARLNIEDSIWTDNRFLSLCMKLQSIDTALGALIRSWMLAQKWYLKTPTRRVPLAEWQKQNLPKELFDCGLAIIQDNRWVHVAGCDDQFGWLLKCVESGKKWGKGRGKNQGGEIPFLGENSTKTQPNEITDKSSKGTLSVPKGKLTSSSSSSSSSFSFSDSKKYNVGIRTNYPQEFEELWVKYGRRGDKKSALEEWKKLKITDLERAMLNRSIDRYIQNNELKFRKHFCRYLKTDWREVEPILETRNGNTGINWDEFETNSGEERGSSHG